MIALAAVAALWLILVVTIAGHRALRRSYRLAILVPVVAYGLVSCWTLGGSCLHARRLLRGFGERRSEAESRMARALEALPDTVRNKRVVHGALKLEERIRRASSAFGPFASGVVWNWRIFPAFDADLLARNLNAHVGTPPLIVHAAGESARNAYRLHECALAHETEFPFGQSRSALYVGHLLGDDLAAQQSAGELCELVDFVHDDPADPRSRSYLLARCAVQMIGKQAKINELLDIACDAFDDLLVLRVRRAYPVTTTGEIDWQPYSPLFMEYSQLLFEFRGISMLDARWMGDPPRPTVGSVDAFYRLDCEATGAWPKGQETWTDPETGETGPTYYVDATTAQYYGEGVQFCKWPRQPDIRTPGFTEVGQGWRFAGLPAVIVDKTIFLPPEPKRRRP